MPNEKASVALIILLEIRDCREVIMSFHQSCSSFFTGDPNSTCSFPQSRRWLIDFSALKHPPTAGNATLGAPIKPEFNKRGLAGATFLI